MPILALGVSYRRAPVELLERLAFSSDEYPKAYRLLLEMEAVREGVILSTCNRAEVHAEVTAYHSGFLDLKRFLMRSREVGEADLAEPLYSHYEDDAAEHLFSVASGIDSMVVGEPQILSQVRGAIRRAVAEGAAGPSLSALFHSAVRTGRRARAETAIGASPGAFVEAGIGLGEKALGDLSRLSALVVGAGGMAALAARHLRERGVRQLRILNRSVERARRLAALTGGEGGGLDRLAAALARADLVVSSTGAAGTVIGAAAVRAAMARRAESMFLLDLAVPRDVEPAAAEVPGVHLADIDDLRQALPGHGTGREMAAEIDAVHAIVIEEVRRFGERRRAARLAPLIQALRAHADQIKDAELARMASRLAGLAPREREAVEALAAGIVAKILHRPIVKLKELSAPSAGDAPARVLADLFGIDHRALP
jgi:glutamyl-tRNA reductase